MSGRIPTLLFVHAHPDDETISTGLAIAHHARLGHRVHVLTATLGEEGEVIPPELAHLEGAGEALAAHRAGELGAAVAVLGATSEVLGHRDSGMAGSTAAGHPRAWSGIPLERAAAEVRDVVDRIAPDVVITYDATGGYGHPDHIRTHDAVCAALASMAAPPVLYAALTPLSWARADRAWLGENVDPAWGWTVAGAGEGFPPSVVADDVVTHAVIAEEDPAEGVVAVQARAMAAHETQIIVAPEARAFALSNLVAARLSGREGYARMDPCTGRPVAPTGGEGFEGGAARRGLLDGVV